MTAFGFVVMVACFCFLFWGSKIMNRYTDDLSDIGLVILFAGCMGAAIFLIGVSVKLWWVMP